MNDDEDLFDNPFFMGLKKQFATQYSEVETGCHVVLVPSADSLNGVDITQALIDAHIFRLDPDSQSRHIGVFDSTKVVDIKRGQVTLVAGFGPHANASIPEANGTNGSHMHASKSKSAPKETSIPIKFEELFYNKSAQAFRVICIEHPTTGHTGKGGDLTRLGEIRTFDECQAFLFADYMNAFVLTKLEKTYICDFVARFGRGPSTESEIAVRTAELVDQVINQLVCANHEWKEIQNKRKATMKQLELIVETWTLGRVAPTVMSALMQSFDLVDREVHRVLRANQGITLHNLHLRSELICDFSTAIELASHNFDKVTSPVEKLLLMQDIIENIQRTIELSQSTQRISDNVLASDDLIPIIVFVLLQAKPQHLNATLYYVKHFTRSNIKTSQIGFHLATFTAAAEFIKTDHLPQSGFNLHTSGDYVAHPLDPVRSPHFDPYAAGIEHVPAASSRAENRRSMSYITPPVSVTTSAISTGRSFGAKSATTSLPPEDADYGFTVIRPNLSRSISTYDHGRSYSTGNSKQTTPSPVRSNYGSMSTTQQPIYPTYAPPSVPMSQPSQTTQTPKGPESITLTPEESQMFFSNLKSFGASSTKGGR